MHNGRVALLTLGALAAIAAPTGAQRLTPLSGSVLHELSAARHLGHLQTSRPLVVAVTLRHDLAALRSAEAGLYDPHSPSYHHFVTPAQWRARYGTAPARLEAVRRFVTARGLRLVSPGRYGDYVMAVGSVAQVERTFSVRLERYRLGSRTFFANAAAAQVPAGLGVDAVLGLESLDAYHLAGDLRASRTQSQDGCLPGAGACTGSLSAQDLWSAYDMPADNEGQGQTIAIIGEGQTDDVKIALRRFEETRGLPRVPVQVIHTDPADAKIAESARDDAGRIEWELDSQASTGMAPKVDQLRMYFGTSLQLPQLTGALANWVNDLAGPLQASASLGLCEDNPALHPLIGADQRADEVLLTQAAMEGRTLFASTGDTGSSCSFPGQEAVNGVTYGDVPTDEYPAVDPNVVAVGGTAVWTDGTDHPKIVEEHAWDHTGGGPSKFVAQPDYQKGASPFLASNVCVTQSDGTPYTTPGQLCRGNADVSALSGDMTGIADHRLHGKVPTSGNGYDIVDYCPPGSKGTGPNSVGPVASPEQACVYGQDPPATTDHFSEGGTSLSSPLWLGMWARVQAHHDAVDPVTHQPDPAKSLGFANNTIYKLAQGSATAHDFHDIVVGNNPLPAAPGWDFPTGWGSPDLKNLIADATGDGATAAAGAGTQAPTDPAPIFAQAGAGAPACSYLFYDSSADAPDPVTGSQEDQLDIVEGDFGLTPDKSALRAVLTIRDLSKDIPTGATYLDYQIYWNYTAPGASSPTTYAADVQVDSSGAVTYADGTMTVTQGNYQFNANANGHATGTFGAGKNGKIEVDVPLADVGNPKLGDVLQSAGAYSADGAAVFGFIVDQDGPAPDYHLGQPTCIDG